MAEPLIVNNVATRTIGAPELTVQEARFVENEVDK